MVVNTKTQSASVVTSSSFFGLDQIGLSKRLLIKIILNLLEKGLDLSDQQTTLARNCDMTGDHNYPERT
jgi:hypothetical protein